MTIVAFDLSMTRPAGANASGAFSFPTKEVLPMKSVVAFDLSLTRPACAWLGGVESFTTGKMRGWERVDAITDWAIARVLGADYVFIEGYSYGSKGRSTLDLAELGGIIRKQIHDMGWTQVCEVPPSLLKQYATGKGNATKDDMLTAARAAGAQVANHDEADAWWLYQFACEVLD